LKAQDGLIALVRNHEVPAAAPGQRTPAFGPRSYDLQCGGGTTTTLFDTKAEKVVGVTPSLSGTLVNCAAARRRGVPGCRPRKRCSTRSATAAPQPHGYIFEVPHDGISPAPPITGMGRFWHEAIAVDPATGIVYETEDRAAAGCIASFRKRRGAARGRRIAAGARHQGQATVRHRLRQGFGGQPSDVQ
jgi:hypothetical protein